MKIEQVRKKIGKKLFITSCRITESKHGINDSMFNMIGKYYTVDSVEHDWVNMGGYIWDPKDLDFENPKEVKDVSPVGKSMKIDPTDIF